MQDYENQIGNRIVLSDFDDTIIKTSDSLKALGLTHNEFYYDEIIFNKYQELVIDKAEFTDLGKLLVEKYLDRLIILTAAHYDKKFIYKKFGVSNFTIYTWLANNIKVDFLNSMQTGSYIYFDDILQVINKIDNDRVKGVWINKPSI